MPFFRRHWVRACRHVLESLLNDALCKDRRCCRTVANDIVRLAGGNLDELSAHILKRLDQLDFLGDSYSIAAYLRWAEFLVEDYIATAWPQGGADRSGQCAYAIE